MRKNVYTSVLVIFAASILAESALAQCVYRQPWRYHRASFESRVQSCQNPVPMDLVALDDFECEEGGTIVRLRWWGVLLAPPQANQRPYYIAIYSDNGNCQPLEKLYEACVVPHVKRVGTDCYGDRVFRFSSAIPPFTINAGEHYWLQISEIDNESARPDVEDFRWSGRRPLRYCDAIQRDAFGTTYSPLLDACDNQPDDLSFAFTTVSIGGSLSLPSGTGVFSGELIDPVTGDVVESAVIEVEPDGFWEWWPEVVGEFHVAFNGMGATTLHGDVTIEPGTDSILDFPTYPEFGDLNGDDTIGLPDLAILLGNYGV